MRNALGPTILLAFLASVTTVAENWPHWRGPSRNGLSRETGLPVSWGATCSSESPKPERKAGGATGLPLSIAAVPPAPQGRGGGQEGRPLTPLACANIETKNVAWKLPLPAYSGSTPIIWGNTIFLNVATGANTGELELWAVDRTNQSVAWKRRLADTNHMERKQNMSSPSPVTDGQHVWVMTGLGIFKAFDFAGKEIWTRNIQTDYGKFGLNWGYASSPLLQGDALYVQVLHGMKTDDPSYVLKIDKMTGKTLWRVERPTNAVHESPGLLHHSRMDRGQRPGRAHHHGRRRRLWPRSGDGPRVLARGRSEPAEESQLPDRCLSDDCRRASSSRQPAKNPMVASPARGQR